MAKEEPNKEHFHFRLKKTHFFIIAILGILLVSLQIFVTMFKGNCDEPYVSIGGRCCMDNNKNNICDDDDVLKSQVQGTGEAIPGVIRLTTPNDVTIASGDTKNVVIKIGNDGTAQTEFFKVTLTQDYNTPNDLVSFSLKSDAIKVTRGKEGSMFAYLKVDDKVEEAKLKYNIKVKNNEQVYAEDSFDVYIT